MAYKLPQLDYDYDSLEPYIDETTMRLHHTKHHQTYIDKLNKALEGKSELREKPIEDLIREIESVPEEIRTAVRNNGGGHLNHIVFWNILKKEIEIKGVILDAVNDSFGSVENFKREFKESAMSVFGSGWAWLVLDGKKLKIMNTKGHDNPISDGKIPLLLLDMWEHAYYLKYQNRKSEYIDAFFNVVNWDEVNELFVKGKSV